MEVVVNGANAALSSYTPAGSLCVPGDSSNAITVGAVPYNNPSAIESFSSRGPTTDSRVKPDLVGPDGVSTTFGAFPGTSAATPHVAGAALLVKNRYPSYTLIQIQSYLESNAADLGQVGKDNTFGSGRVYLPALPGSMQKLVGVNENTASLGNEDPNLVLFDKFTAEASGTLSQIRIKCGAYGNVKVAVYADSGGSPGNLLAAVNGDTAVIFMGWNQIPISPIQVTAGTSYWLAMISDQKCINYLNSGGPDMYRAATYNGFTFPNPAGGGLTTWATGGHLIAGWGN